MPTFTLGTLLQMDQLITSYGSLAESTKMKAMKDGVNEIRLGMRRYSTTAVRRRAI